VREAVEEVAEEVEVEVEVDQRVLRDHRVDPLPAERSRHTVLEFETVASIYRFACLFF